MSWCADTAGLASAARVAFWSQGGRAIAAQRERLKAQLEELYATTFNLANYVEQNRTGFRKILKKHDKLVSVRCGVWLKDQPALHECSSAVQKRLSLPRECFYSGGQC